MLLHKINSSMSRRAVGSGRFYSWKKSTSSLIVNSSFSIDRNNNTNIFSSTEQSVARNFSSSSNDEAIRIGMTHTERQQYYDMGYVDERALIKFTTLHEMQIRACQIFAKKNLFGTYAPESKQFEWMTYKECKLHSFCFLAFTDPRVQKRQEYE